MLSSIIRIDSKNLSMNIYNQLRLTNLLLLISFFFIYLEWGHGSSSFMFDVLREMFDKKDDLLSTLLHPVVLPTLVGLILLLTCVLLPRINRWFNLLAVLLPSAIVAFVFLIGVFGMNARITLSTLPFILVSIQYFRIRRQIRKTQEAL